MEYFGELAKLRPAQLKEIIDNRPIVYVPSGILEWHDEQNPMGLDTLKVEEMALRAARITGGVVHMPSYIGAGAFYGKFYFGTTCALDHGGVNFTKDFVKEYLLTLFEQLEWLGFRLIVVVYGHTNGDNINAHELAAREYMLRQDTKAKILMVSDVSPVIRCRYKLRDHAAKYETSFMMSKYPETVDLHAIDPNHGQWWGRDPRIEASAEVGEQMYQAIADALVSLVHHAEQVSKEELLRLTFAAGERCWETCQNIRDLQTNYWKADPVWEDPGCCMCLWRSKGLVEYLVQLKGREWTERIITGWNHFIATGDADADQFEHSNDLLIGMTGDSIREINEEWAQL